MLIYKPPEEEPKNEETSFQKCFETEEALKQTTIVPKPEKDQQLLSHNWFNQQFKRSDDGNAF